MFLTINMTTVLVVVQCSGFLEIQGFRDDHCTRLRLDLARKKKAQPTSHMMTETDTVSECFV